MFPSDQHKKQRLHPAYSDHPSTGSHHPVIEDAFHNCLHISSVASSDSQCSSPGDSPTEVRHGLFEDIIAGVSINVTGAKDAVANGSTAQ
ncbi:hypothetical protein PpBr36_02574 [Pyricularia pennisetigena]|uniref:hypothetical protein n=1 Tax=Pyricularia pennisetigena TaxID=1578925 RepID=UPI00114D5A00|nr:hypothetical protein PpBr36_02574 [Pyricularia pennisetigena]TLS31542.1 hypothetical protein PpBr36_02574 [Pyricularia pennisetigena]